MELHKISNNSKRSLVYVIQNIVVKVTSFPTSDLNLEMISKKLKNATYDKDRFPGLFLKILNPKCSVILFRNGKMILSGIKLFDDIQIIIKHILQELIDSINLNLDPQEVESEIVNIVITANFFNKIDINLAAVKLNNVIFEPEIFPALIFKEKTPVKCVFLVFNNGKIVLTGIKNKEFIEPALTNFGKIMKTENLFL